MTTTPTPRPIRRRLRFAGVALSAGILFATACSGTTTASSTTSSSIAAIAVASSTGASSSLSSSPADDNDDSATTSASATAADDADVTGSFLDASTVHTISVTFDQTAYDAMIATYQSSGEKEWIEATVTIDGVTYTQVGLRLKGNSSLQSLRSGGNGNAGPNGTTLSADDPETLPWLIKLDKYVDGQEHEGEDELVVRSNSSETSLNEAVALALLTEAGLASQDAVAVKFTVNDTTVLRLVVQNPDGDWTEDDLGDGNLYKADSSGDYSYRGTDADAYSDAWSQDAGDDDLTPLITFLDFVNNSDDATFAADLDQYLDVEAFARYLAFEDLLQNWDDIDGPGNNSYLYYDTTTKKMTVVAWDHNLALSSSGPGGGGQGAGPMGGGPMGGGPMGGGGQRPNAGQTTDTNTPGNAAGPMGKSNVLVERFNEVDAFVALYDAAKAELQTQLLDSGTATEILDQWTSVLTAQASDLVSTDTITSEAAAIAAFFTAA